MARWPDEKIRQQGNPYVQGLQMNCENDFSQITVNAIAIESNASLKLTPLLEEDFKNGELILSAKISNTGASAAHLDSIELSLDLSALSLTNSRVLAGSGRMGVHVNRFDIAKTPFEIASEQFLLFRKSPKDYIFAGLLTWRTFHGEIAFKDGILKIRFPGDAKIIRPGEDAYTEKVLLGRPQNWQDALSRYAETVARENKISPKLAAWQGWGTWDYYGDKFGERQILENLSALKANKAPCNLIQLDDGYSVWGGDWLSLKPQDFPNGMKSLTSKIEKTGCSTGIWVAPFLTHKNSKLAAEHPDWLLQTGSGPLTMAPYPYYVIDYSLDEPCAWIADVLSTMKHTWGIKYFKLDFLGMGIKPCRSAVDGVTPVERFHRCFNAVKAALGEDVYVLGCSANFGPCLGYVDGMRTGPDITPQYPHVKGSAFSNISSYFMHGKLFNCDPDYIVLRAKEDEDAELIDSPSKKGKLSLEEAQSWADFVSVFGNAAIASDKLPILRKERFDILRKVLEDRPSDECVPLDLWAGDATSIPACILAKKDGSSRLAIFNWSEGKTEIRISGFLPDERFLTERTGIEVAPESGTVTIELDKHSSKILLYQGGRSFDKLRKELVPETQELAIDFPSILGHDFKPEGKAVQLDLGDAAQCPLMMDRMTGRSMIHGLYAGVAEQNSLLGIPMKLGDPKKARAIEMRSCDTPRKISFKIGRKLKSLYILHGCECPVKGELNSYLLKFKGHVEELKLTVGIHIGNTHAHYINPWTSKIARVAWHDPRTEACLFVMEWKSPFPDETLVELEATWPMQHGNVFIVGAVGYE